MDIKKKRLAAFVLAALLIVMGLSLLFIETPSAKAGELTVDDLIMSKSERTITTATVLSSGETPYYTLVASPIACYYKNSENTRELKIGPLLVAKNDPSEPVVRFLNVYDTDNIVALGDPGVDIKPNVKIGGENPRTISELMALKVWSHSDGVILIKASCQNAYNIAVPTVPLASYVNIPVIVTHSMDSSLRNTLEHLGVKYSIICGNLEAYGKKSLVLKGDEKSYDKDLGTIQQLTREFIEHPEGLNHNISYITMANPLDITEPGIVETTPFMFQGEIYHHASNSPGVWPGTTGVHTGEDFQIEIPNDYEIALLQIQLRFKPHDQADLTGERMYVFMFDNDDNAQEAFFGTPGGRLEDDYRIVDYDLMLLNNTGKHDIHIQGSECFEGVPIKQISENPVKFDLKIDVHKLDSPIRPLMPELSSLAPYLTAYHKGLVLARSDFALQYAEYTGCINCGEPTLSEEAISDANNKSLFIHSEIVQLLARLAGHEPEEVLGNSDAINSMADMYYNDPVYLGIIADTNMIPHYYYDGGSSSEGYGEPGDTLYADINADPENPLMDLGPGRVDPNMPDVELPVGRLTGFNVQDVSALLCRTFFYYEIIDSFSGFDQGEAHTTWKNNAYAFLGSAIPVEMMYGTLFDHMKESLTEGGFTVKETSEALSHRENSDKFQTGSNYVVGGVHGFYYWYVPAVRTKYAGGSAYDVAHVREMNFGPSTMFLVSCVTGRIDALNPENCLAMAYLHAGVTAYVGATRSTYGGIKLETDLDMRLEPTGAVLLSKYFTEEIMSNNDVGIALRNAKNQYFPDDTNSPDSGTTGIIYGHYIIHGDPAFNPYEPANEGV
ncbi:C25 family cysteine peptidase [[Eubacterium] cellulosolvens]